MTWNGGAKIDDSMVNTATLSSSSSTTWSWQEQDENRRAHWMAKLRKRRLASSTLENQNNIKGTNYMFWFLSWKRCEIFQFYEHRSTDGEVVEFHRNSRNIHWRMSRTRQRVLPGHFAARTFLSLVSSRCFSHFTLLSPIAHMCAWLKTCRGRVQWTIALSSKKSSCFVTFHRRFIDVLDSSSFCSTAPPPPTTSHSLMWLQIYTTKIDLTLTDGIEANRKRYSARRFAVWPAGRIQRSHTNRRCKSKIIW